jgi:lipoprotein-releasing system permease protein
LYKLLLCLRYLRTRYLAMACVISVMLGVATLNVVNSVMAGFSTKLRERLHGLLSDVVIEAPDFDGFYDPDLKMAAIRADPFLNERIEAMTPTLEVFAMLHYRLPGGTVTRPVKLIGIDPVGRALVGGFAEHLVRPENRHRPTFDLSDEAWERYVNRHWPQGLPDAKSAPAGPHATLLPPGEGRDGAAAPDGVPGPKELRPPWDPADRVVPGKPAPEPPAVRPPKPVGVYIGWAITHARQRHPDGTVDEITLLEPGDDVQMTTVKYPNLAPDTRRFVIADYIRTEMSEYDSNYVFMPLADLQRFRNLEGRATSIQIRLKDYRDAKAVVERLSEMFRPQGLAVETWEHKQGALLAAISVEKGILNVLLFMIIAVAGFGILAIFSMIVVEKTRDIGILKALGASNGGVMKIFLGYGLLLGVVGAALGTGLGITVTVYINEIEHALSNLTGTEIFPRDVYYFKEIPTDIQPMSVLLVNLGAVGIAVLFSVLPALRAALLHPVRALRYE